MTGLCALRYDFRFSLCGTLRVGDRASLTLCATFLHSILMQLVLDWFIKFLYLVCCVPCFLQRCVYKP